MKVYHLIASKKFVLAATLVRFTWLPKRAKWRSDLTGWEWSHWAICWLGLGIGVTYQPQGHGYDNN